MTWVLVELSKLPEYGVEGFSHYSTSVGDVHGPFGDKDTAEAFGKKMIKCDPIDFHAVELKAP